MIILIYDDDNIQFIKDLLNYQAWTNNMCYFVCKKKKKAFEDAQRDIRAEETASHLVHWRIYIDWT